MKMLSILLFLALVSGVFYFGYFVPQEKIHTARLASCVEIATKEYSDALGIGAENSFWNQLAQSLTSSKDFERLYRMGMVQDQAVSICFRDNKNPLFRSASDLIRIEVEKTKSLQSQGYAKLKANFDQRLAAQQQRNATCAQMKSLKTIYDACVAEKERQRSIECSGDILKCLNFSGDNYYSECEKQTGYSSYTDTLCQFGL